MALLRSALIRPLLRAGLCGGIGSLTAMRRIARWRAAIGGSARCVCFPSRAVRAGRAGGLPPACGWIRSAISSRNRFSAGQRPPLHEQRTRRNVTPHRLLVLVKQAHLDAPRVLPVLGVRPLRLVHKLEAERVRRIGNVQAVGV